MTYYESFADYLYLYTHMILLGLVLATFWVILFALVKWK